MKAIFILSLCLFTVSSFAMSDEAKIEREKKKAEMFEEAKSDYVSHMSEMISIHSNAKSCASSASDHEGLKKCRKDFRSKMKEMKKSRKEKMKGHKERRKAMRKEMREKYGKKRKNKDKDDM
jgi:hypothetical protein